MQDTYRITKQLTNHFATIQLLQLKTNLQFSSKKRWIYSPTPSRTFYKHI